MSPAKKDQTQDPAEMANPTILPPEADVEEQAAQANTGPDTPGERADSSQPMAPDEQPIHDVDAPATSEADQKVPEPQPEVPEPNPALVQPEPEWEEKEYVVTGAAVVDGHMPGDRFTAALDPVREQMLLQGGHITLGSEVQDEPDEQNQQTQQTQ